MASHDHDPHHAPTAQSIPLQDLSRPPDTQAHVQNGGQAYGSAGEVRTPPRVRNSIGARMASHRSYSRLAESSPSPTERRGLNRILQPFAAAPLSTTDHRAYHDDEEGEISPLDNRGGLQEALGFAGLTMGHEAAEVPFQRPLARRTSSDATGRWPRLSPEVSPHSTPAQRVSEEIQEDRLFVENDTIPLTNPNAGPSSGRRRRPTLQIPDGDRSSFQSVRLSEQGSPGMLGDNLWATDAEGGRLNTPGRGRSASAATRMGSLSPASAGSPLSRAGTMVRKMSQRVVNLSNEPEIVEQTIRKNSFTQPSRLSGPPPIPIIVEDVPEEPDFTPSPVEKAPPLVMAGQAPKQWQLQVNPLKGKSLGIFPANNVIRRKLCDLLVHPATEPIILALIVIQTILLAVDSAPSVYNDPRPNAWGSSRMDYALLIIFIIYTIELVMRIIVSGFMINPKEYSTVGRQGGIAAAALQKIRNTFGQDDQSIDKERSGSLASHQPSILRSFTVMQSDLDQPGHTQQQQRVRLAQRAFLRHSFNRLDFVAVVSFWIAFVLGVLDLESNKHLNVFRMLSCLRILRLLGITSGTSVILRSLKKAAPLLVHVSFLIGFFWLLFAVVGVQSFKSSLRRTCVWVDPAGVQRNFTNSLQFCGGHLNNATGTPEPFLNAEGRPGARKHKGYLCPRNSLCVQKDNPYNGTVSFDNILQSLELVFVIMSSNTFSELLYFTTQSDYMAAALFFAAGIVLMSLWLMNLLVAVITSSFQVIREESKASAFTGAESTPGEETADEAAVTPRRISTLKSLYDKTRWVWITVIVYGLLAQAFRSARMGRSRARIIDASETVVTLILLVEIILRFAADWRNFHRSRRNWVDLGIAVITTIIQIPQIRRSGQPYAWLSIFQVLRVYRVVMALSVTRELLILVLGNVSGILNLVVFVFLITFLAAIFAVQMFRGEIPQIGTDGNPIRVTFYNIYNSFLGMYQVLSSEGWTSILYNVTQYMDGYGTAWAGATFFVLWFILANFIVLNMFIAVIQENFDVSEDEKRLQQIRAFLQQKELGNPSHGNLSLSTILKLGREQRQRDPLDYGPATMEMLLKDAVVRDFLDEESDQTLPRIPTKAMTEPISQTHVVQAGGMSALWQKLRRRFFTREPNPFYAGLQFSRSYDDLDPRTMAKEVVSATERRKRAQREYLQRHPTYNVSLYIFSPANPIRRACQHLVGPGRGRQRVEGAEPNKVLWYSFSAFIYAAIVAMVLLACIATPLYQRDYFRAYRFSVRNWFVLTDLGFALLFTVEAIIKIIADGCFWTPNAYFRGSWGLIDGTVLITLWVDVISSLLNKGEVSRAIGAFKALRALRLLNVSDNARDTFHSVVVLGGWKVVSAAFVSISLLIPFAIYGLNLFNGQMRLCNDPSGGITNLTRHCIGEYSSKLYDWDVVAPRTASNPSYNFDDFGSALFILFQIVSQEGWIDVMWSAQSITGRDRQPRPFASQGNAIYFIVFNLLGAVFVLTLFVTVFMRNYTEQTGVAFLTAEQRSWLEMRKLLRQISPSKRPSNKPNQRWRDWCYRQAIKKHGKWQRFITFVLLLHLVLLILEFYPSVSWWDRTRDYLLFAFTLIYTVNIIVRIVGLTWTRYRRSTWDIYALPAVGGTFVIMVMKLSRFQNRLADQLHKLFLVSITLLLIPRNNQLDQLFKTAAASLPAVGNLLATWFVLFLVYAIALTQTLGLTKFGPLENGSLNFRTVPKALILLFRMSCGEGWNQIMEDFAHMTEPNCVRSRDFLESDCGSAEWARALLISWNILSMYIFVSLFVSLIFESFSYVYQRSSGSSAVSRHEIRRFKQAWATFDPEGTGFISKQTFPRLLGELSGIFEMRIYDGEFTVGKLLEDCRQVSSVGENGPPGRVVEGVNLDLLAQRISRIPVSEIRRRRQRLNVFYEEILVSADVNRGISFTSVLMILAHYKVINDNKSLRLEEFLRRRARIQRIEEQVRRNIVIGFFDMMYWMRYRRRTLHDREASRLQTIPHFAVPEIVVAGEDGIVTGRPPSDGQFFSISPTTSDPFGPSTSTSTSTSTSPAAHMSSRISRPAWDESQLGGATSSLIITPRTPTTSSTGMGLRNRAESKPPSPSSPSSGVDLAMPDRQWDLDHRSPPPSQSEYESPSGNRGSIHGSDESPSNRIGPRNRNRASSSALGGPSHRPVSGSRSGSGLGLSPGSSSGSERRQGPRAGEGARSGSGSISRQSVLEVLDQSAWGESIRRNFSVGRRPSRDRDPPL
ncbi:MAG: hypothetical protein M1823_005974 [Watsoniomyces obsoletus]|nr:MAG: hypothetical protein M1823_005974 [Watsoniomyces obsoletus]